MEILDIRRIRITTDDDYPDKIEIDILDENGDAIEGGQFDLDRFMAAVIEFYNREY
jgi:hypothetical protein